MRLRRLDVSGGICDEAFGLGAGLFIAADHVEVDHGAGGGEGAKRMGGHPVTAEEAAFFRREDDEEDGTLGAHGVGCEGFGEFDDADGAGAVVVCAVPDLRCS